MIFEDGFILDVILALVMMASLFLSIILYTRLTFILDRRWKANLTTLFQTLLAQYVNAQNIEVENKIRKRIVKISKSKASKQILLDQVSELYDNFNGRCSDMAKDLYNDLSLYKISMKKLKSWKWHVKMEGIVELSTMGHRKAYELIVPLMQDKNKDVRRTAKIGLVELKKSRGLEDLANLPTEMSEWTFLSILSILHRSPVKLSNHDLNKLKNSNSETMKALTQHLEKHSLIH